MPPFRQASLPTTASSPSEYQDTLRVVHKTRPSAYIRHLHLYCVCSVTFSCSELWGEDRFHRGGFRPFCGVSRWDRFGTVILF